MSQVLPDINASVSLPPHRLSIALLQPQIAPNTGNIARLCVAAGAALHLVRPLGFLLTDRQIRRSAMDYWPRLKLTLHDDTDSFFQHISRDPQGSASSPSESQTPPNSPQFWLFTSKSSQNLWQTDFSDGDILIFGNETHGLPAGLLDRYADRTVRIPQADGERCLNLSTAAGIGLFEALRQVRPPSTPK
jgi:tRNA (cytidine/uridine-2'-O-)-methyltransferase